MGQINFLCFPSITLFQCRHDNWNVMNFNSVKTNTNGARSTNIRTFNLSSLSSNCTEVRVSWGSSEKNCCWLLLLETKNTHTILQENWFPLNPFLLCLLFLGQFHQAKTTLTAECKKLLSLPSKYFFVVITSIQHYHLM